MVPFVAKRNEEATTQNHLITYLRAREWLVKVTHGNGYQSGFPDLFATHPVYKMRWIEVKVATQFSFTKAQVQDFPRMEASGSPIWVLNDATDIEYAKLFKPSNFQFYFSAFLAGISDINKWSR